MFVIIKKEEFFGIRIVLINDEIHETSWQSHLERKCFKKKFYYMKEFNCKKNSKWNKVVK